MKNKKSPEEVLALQIADILAFVERINDILDGYRRTAAEGDDAQIEEWQRQRDDWFAQLSNLLARYKIRAELSPLPA